jgi:superkiller protein 3
MKLLLTISFLLLLALSVFAQEGAARFGATLAEARALINAGKPQAAIAKLQTLPPSNDLPIAQLLGLAYYHAHDHANAVKHLAPIATQLPKDSAAQRQTVQILGLSLYLLGHLPEAVEYLAQTRAWAPDDPELAYVLGMACIQTRQPEPGRAAFARMFRVAPDTAAAHLLTAQMMQRVELYEAAAAEAKQALAKDPRLPQANYLLAQLAIFQGQLDEGIALLERELALNPGNANAYYKLGDAYTRQVKWDEAISALQKSVWLNPYYSGPYILLGKSYLKKRALPNAEAMLKRAIQFDPNNKSAHYLLGQVYAQSGRAADAKREFAIAEKLLGDPEEK